MTTILIPIEVTDRQALDIISTALEGGIGYWSKADVLVRGTAEDDLDYVETDLYDAEDSDILLGRLNVAAVLTGITLAAKVATDPESHNRYAASNALRMFMEDDIDSEGADTFVQLGVLGDVVYG